MFLKEPVSIDFDLFFSGLREMKALPYCNETSFCIESDPEYSDCWLGCLDGEKPYWFGLPGGNSRHLDFASAEELVEARVFNGHSLRELWPRVRFYAIGDIDPVSWLIHNTQPN